MKTPAKYLTRQTKPVREFPKLALCPTRILQGCEQNEDGEFSSRELTTWYVERFCSENHLTK